MAITNYSSPCNGGTKQNFNDASGCFESGEIKDAVLFDPGFDFQAFQVDLDNAADDAARLALWEQAVTDGDIQYIIKNVGGQLPEPSEEAFTDVRRNPQLNTYTYSVQIDFEQFKSNEDFINWLNDNYYGFGFVMEDDSFIVFLSNERKFVRSKPRAKALTVEGQLRNRLMVDIKNRTMPLSLTIPTELVS